MIKLKLKIFDLFGSENDIFYGTDGVHSSHINIRSLVGKNALTAQIICSVCGRWILIQSITVPRKGSITMFSLFLFFSARRILSIWASLILYFIPKKTFLRFQMPMITRDRGFGHVSEFHSSHNSV